MWCAILVVSRFGGAGIPACRRSLEDRQECPSHQNRRLVDELKSRRLPPGCRRTSRRRRGRSVAVLVVALQFTPSAVYFRHQMPSDTTTPGFTVSRDDRLRAEPAAVVEHAHPLAVGDAARRGVGRGESPPSARRPACAARRRSRTSSSGTTAPAGVSICSGYFAARSGLVCGSSCGGM